MPHRILLADDSLTIQKVVELTFSDAEFEIRAVGNGDDAVRALEEFRPDIVLADAFMPGLTGYEVCERVKALPGSPLIPVVLLAGTFEPFDRARAERSGADSIVTKPFDSHALASLVRDLVEKSREPAVPPQAVPPPAEARAATGFGSRWDDPTDPDVAVLHPSSDAAPSPVPAAETAPAPFAVESPFPVEPGPAAAAGAPEDAFYRTAAIPVGVVLAAARPSAFELADPFGDEPVRPPTEPIQPVLPPEEADQGVPATTLPLRLDAEEVGGAAEEVIEESGDEAAAERAEAVTGPIAFDEPAPARGEEPFGPPPVMVPQEEFLVEPAGVHPRDIEADLEAFESSGRGRTRPEVWDQAEAMGLTGPREEPTWPEEPGLADAPAPEPDALGAAESLGTTENPEAPETLAPAEPADTEAVRAEEPAHESEHQLAPDAGAFDLAEAEGVQHRDLEALAAEARRTDLNELIPGRAASVAALSAAASVASVAPAAVADAELAGLDAGQPRLAAGPVSLTDADVDRIARRVAELVGEASLREVAWEIVPEIAERVVRQRIRELEGE